MSKDARNKMPPAEYSQDQPLAPTHSKFPVFTRARIIAIGITVKILKDVINRLRALSG